ncbi:MAG: hypothetical protein HKP27_12770 [Myxococcales bacterium]|nr:hypothetical protein [Myxococcales bacterium]
MMFAIPEPLHPAVVHLPIALAVLIPGLALLAAVTIRLKLVAARTWWAVLLLQLVLLGSIWAALETGEDEEERVERVVAERHIEAHEELAERFQLVGAVALVFVAGGLLPGTAGGFARAAAVLATLGVLAAGVQVGHSGGELVYRYGAAGAYIQGVDGGASGQYDSTHDR